MAKKKPQPKAKGAPPGQPPGATPNPRPPRRKKSTLAEVRRRVFEVLKLLLAGADLHQICDYAALPEHAWGLSRSQIFRYIKAANRLMQRHFDAKAGHLLARHAMQRRLIYAHAMEEGDYRTALAALDSEAKLEGLFPPVKVAPTDPTGTKPYDGGLSEDERRPRPALRGGGRSGHRNWSPASS
jgi:hypothetical protein